MKRILVILSVVIALPLLGGHEVGSVCAAGYQPATMPTTSMRSTSALRASSAPVYTTSSATVHTVGSGGGATGGSYSGGGIHRGSYTPVQSATAGVPAVQLPALSITSQNLSSVEHSVRGGGTPSRPRRVGEDETDPDPYSGPAAPIGDTPWLIMALLGIGYIAFRAFRHRKTSRINQLA